MNIDLNYEQLAQIELISMHAGKPPAQVLTEAAQFLLNCETDYYPSFRPAHSQQFLSEEELRARLKRLLRH